MSMASEIDLHVFTTLPSNCVGGIWVNSWCESSEVKEDEERCEEEEELLPDAEDICDDSKIFFFSFSIESMASSKRLFSSVGENFGSSDETHAL